MTTARKGAATKASVQSKASKAVKAKKTAKPRSALSLMKFPRPSLTAQLAGKAEALTPRLQAAVDKSEIADVLFNFARAIDRLDENLLRSVLHHDATLDLGPGVFQGMGGDYVHWVLGVFSNVRSSHHMVANIRIELEGDVANVESYYHTHVRVEKPIGREDVFLGGRYLDRLERRPSGAAGVWKIVHRKELIDWARTEAASDIFYHQNPDAYWLQRTKADPSYQMAQLPGSNGGGKLPSFLGRHYESKSVKF
ncbi:MAG: nuclear transport factor 2 family protein [Alphaproteobacteria bacterium]|nr:nuclear transport factor 2 family protein [Alphaproteobacteria bacterium]